MSEETPKEKSEETPKEKDQQKQIKEKQTPFWFDDPNILINQYQLFPADYMTIEEKLNAISRVIIIATLLAFVATRKIRILIIGILTLVAFIVYYHSQKKKARKEGFGNGDASAPTDAVLKEKGITVPTDVFDEPTADNPFSNVMVPDYQYNVDKKPAPPSFAEPYSQKVLREAKQMVINANQTQPDIANKLFKNLGDQFDFEQSMRPFVSQPNTTIPSDQAGFAQFCYGSMVSSRDGNLFALARNKSNYNLY